MLIITHLGYERGWGGGKVLLVNLSMNSIVPEIVTVLCWTPCNHKLRMVGKLNSVPSKLSIHLASIHKKLLGSKIVLEVTQFL